MRYMLCQQATNRFRPSELTKHYPRCPLTVITFDVAQFFPSLNYVFLSSCLKKAGLNCCIINFFNSYHDNQSTKYFWNNFLSPPFIMNVGIGQSSALSPILSAIYMAPILKTFEKRIKNININKNKNNNKTSSINILSYVDDSLIIS